MLCDMMYLKRVITKQQVIVNKTAVTVARDVDAVPDP